MEWRRIKKGSLEEHLPDYGRAYPSKISLYNKPNKNNTYFVDQIFVVYLIKSRNINTFSVFLKYSFLLNCCFSLISNIVYCEYISLFTAETQKLAIALKYLNNICTHTKHTPTLTHTHNTYERKLTVYSIKVFYFCFCSKVIYYISIAICSCYYYVRIFSLIENRKRSVLCPFVLWSVTFYLMRILLKFMFLIWRIIFIAFLCSSLLYYFGQSVRAEANVRIKDIVYAQVWVFIHKWLRH